MRVVLSAGEASGDAIGAALAGELAARGVTDISGLGGVRMRAAGVRLVDDSSRWGAISIAQSLRVARRAAGGYFRMKRELAERPGVFVPIDFGYVNIRLAKWAKSKGWRVFYLMPPGSWRRDRQGGDLPLVTDDVVTPFSWSADLLREAGARAHWFGHPLKALRAASVEQPPTGRYVAALPGSRGHEVTENLRVFAQVVEGLLERLVFALAPGADEESIAAEWRALRPERDDEFRTDATRPVLAGACAALVCSGTATLEAALAGTPTVVVYALSKSMRREIILTRYKRPKYIALPNILLERDVVPEHAEKDGVDPAIIRRDLDAILAEGPVREAQLAAFRELDTLLGPGESALAKTAELILQDSELRR